MYGAKFFELVNLSDLRHWDHVRHRHEERRITLPNRVKYYIQLDPTHPYYEPPEISPDRRNNPYKQYRDIRICEYSREYPFSWFAKLENEFDVCLVTESYQKCQILIRHLDLETIEIIKELCEYKYSNSAYIDFKNTILREACLSKSLRDHDPRFCEDQALDFCLQGNEFSCFPSVSYKRTLEDLDELFNEIRVDSTSPSKIWLEMMDLLHDDCINPHIIKDVWLKFLPIKINRILMVYEKATIDELIKCADTLYLNWQAKVPILPNQLRPETFQLQTLTSHAQERKMLSEAIFSLLKTPFYNKSIGSGAQKCK